MSDKSISPLRQRMIDDMRMRQLAPKTQANYLRIVREFARYLGRSPDTATVEDLRTYQLHLVDHGVSPISLNAAKKLEFCRRTRVRYGGADVSISLSPTPEIWPSHEL